MSLASFKIPGTVVYGQNALEHLKELKGTRAMLVTGGSSMERFGFLATATEYLKIAGMEVEIFNGVEPNPSVKTVKAGSKAMLDFKPDWIIAIGGGSAIDAAKIMWAFYEYPDLTFEKIIPLCSLPELRKKARFAAIPSTSGTASEITSFSVITDTENHIKYPIVSPHIVPDIAIIDPALPEKMPPHITANTGMDTMAHAVEAFVSTGATCFTDPLAYQAITLVMKSLKKAYDNPQDKQAREDMHNASAMAGMAFSNCSLGIVHSMAHKIGGEFGVTHGLANAILMPYVIEYNRQFTDKYDLLEKMLDIGDISALVKELNESMGIPDKFSQIKEITIKRSDFEKILDRMSENSFNDPCTLTNPVKPKIKDIKEIFKKAF